MAIENENTEIIAEDGVQEPASEPEQTLFDVVSDALDEETIGLEADEGTPNEITEPKDEEGAEEDAGESADDEATEEAGDQEAEPLEGEAPKDGDPAKTPDGEPVAAGAKDAAAKVVDPVNDPIPEGLKQSTKERIQTLASMVNEGKAAATERDEMLGLVMDTGATAEQYGATLGWLQLYNSSRIEDRREAFNIMQMALVGLATEIGEVAPGVNVLAQHADLQTEVEEGTLTQKRAEEIAAGRNRKVAADTAATTARATASETQTANAAVKKGQNELTALEVALKASDAQYLAKRAIIVPALREAIRNVHPSLWAITFKTAYENVKLPAAPVTPTPPATPPIEPLRPKQPAGQGAKRAPTSMAEAIDFSLGQFDDDA